MKAYFLDTGYLLALELAKDQNYPSAVQHWQQFLKTSPRLVTTSYVFDEVVTFFNSRGHHAKAVQIGNSLLQSCSVDFVFVDNDLFGRGWDYFQKHQDKTYSLTDCISFVLMQDRGITTALTFDAHFQQAGFLTEP